MINNPCSEAFIDFCRDIAKRKLIYCSSGNVSWKYDTMKVVMTGTGAWLERLKEDDLSFYDFETNEFEGAKPTSEKDAHLGIYEEKRFVDVILHYQSVNATTVACSPSFRVEDLYIIPEIPYYIGSICLLDKFNLPGSWELKNQIIDASIKNNLIILPNHGIFVIGKDFDEVIQRSVFFELACEIYLKNEGKVRRLPDDAIKQLSRI